MTQMQTFNNGLRYRHWQPEGEVRAAVLLVHGLGEHSGRYEALARAFTQQGLAVVAPDHLGHGESPGQRVFLRDFDEYLPGIRQCRALIGQQYTNVPCFILGHSMGGLLTGRVLLDDASQYRGALFSGPAFAATEPPGALTLLIGRVLAKIAPGLGMLALDPSGVSRDPAVVRAYMDDPLVNHGKVTAGLGIALFDAMALVMSRAGEITLPVLVMHGEADTMAAPAGSKDFVTAIGSEDKTLELLPGLFHEIFNEPEGPEIIQRYADWINARL